MKRPPKPSRHARHGPRLIQIIAGASCTQIQSTDSSRRAMLLQYRGCQAAPTCNPNVWTARAAAPGHATAAVIRVLVHAHWTSAVTGQGAAVIVVADKSFGSG
uniref:Uncharacterized protein n=1 Tax=Peronospora matthiolae TaxID=2874970 RepID=A0AAV1V117_9STRA